MYSLIFIFILLLLLFLLIIYLIFRNLKETEEHFNSIIEVHYDEEMNEQYLYKFNLEDTNLTITSVKPTILVKNIMALYPIDNDIVYLLDSIHDIYKVNFTDESVSTIKISGNKVGYPVKLVGNVSHVYILSSEGYIYEIIDDVYAQQQNYLSDVIDIALCGDKLYYITKDGQLYSYSNGGLLIEDVIYFIQIIGSGPNYLFGLTPSKSIKRINLVTLTVDPTFTHTADTIDIKLISSDSMFGYITNSNNFYHMLNSDANINIMHYHSNVKDAMFNGINTEVQEETSSPTTTPSTNYHRRIVLDTFGNLHMSDYSNLGILNPKSINNGPNQVPCILFAGINVNNIFVLIDKITPADPVINVDLANMDTHEISTSQCPSSNCDFCDETNYDFSCQAIYLAINSLITGDPNSYCEIESVPAVIVNTFTFYKYDNFREDNSSGSGVVNIPNNLQDENHLPLEVRLKRCSDALNCGFFVIIDQNIAYFKESITPIPTQSDSNAVIYSKTLIHNINPTQIIYLDIYSDDTTTHRTEDISLVDFYQYDGYDFNTQGYDVHNSNGSLESHLNWCANATNSGLFVMNPNYGNAYFKSIIDWNSNSPLKTSLNLNLISKTKIPNMIPTKYYRLYLNEDGTTHYMVTRDIEQPSVCAQETETCNCIGTVYYGRKLTGNTSGDPVSFNEMVLDNYNTAESTDSIACNHNGNLGGDPLLNVWKQCWCVPDTTYIP